MNKSSYEDQKKHLIAAIDIAVKSFQVYLPKNWNDSTRLQAVNTYLSWKNGLMNPDPKFKNNQSLTYIKNDVLTYFQESSGETVDYFWKQIKNAGLEFKRENKLKKVLQRRKIKSQIEYDFIIDVLIPYQQEGLITKDELNLLNGLLLAYENINRVPTGSL